MTDPALDPVPDPVRALLALFDDTLADVRFPDVDGPALTDLAEKVRESAADLERARAEVEAARATLAAHQDTLTQRAGRALAYARVYAEGDEALSAQLADISLGKKNGAKKKPGRKKGSGKKKKAAASDADLLPLDGAAADHPQPPPPA